MQYSIQAHQLCEKTPERRAKEITSAYRLKFRQLDKLFAVDVVGDGSNGVVGPFESAQSQFYRRQVIPICSGWSGEKGGDFGNITKLLAREAAFGDDGMSISPLVNTDQKGDAYPAMLQQFRRAIGAAIV